MITGIALGVYAGFKYLLPLVIPFFIALGLAEMLRPAALWLQKKFSFSFHGKRFLCPLGMWGGIVLLAFGLGITALTVLGGKKLLQEGRLLLYNLPRMLDEADIVLSGWCRRLEGTFQLEKNSVVLVVREMLERLLSYAASRIMPYVMGNTMPWLTAFIPVMVFLSRYFRGIEDRWKRQISKTSAIRSWSRGSVSWGRSRFVPDRCTDGFIRSWQWISDR